MTAEPNWAMTAQPRWVSAGRRKDLGTRTPLMRLGRQRG
jgi:hypothetical protein